MPLGSRHEGKVDTVIIGDTESCVCNTQSSVHKVLATTDATHLECINSA